DAGAEYRERIRTSSYHLRYARRGGAFADGRSAAPAHRGGPRPGHGEGRRQSLPAQLAAGARAPSERAPGAPPGGLPRRRAPPAPGRGTAAEPPGAARSGDPRPEPAGARNAALPLDASPDPARSGRACGPVPLRRPVPAVTAPPRFRRPEDPLAAVAVLEGVR